MENLFPILFSEIMLVVEVDTYQAEYIFLVSYTQQKDGSCFHIHSVSLCLFIVELSSLMLKNIDQQCGHSCHFSLVVFMCLPFWGFVDVILSVTCIFVGAASFFWLKFSF